MCVGEYSLILGTFWRKPLGDEGALKAMQERSRETIFTTDRDPYPRVLGIYGGKLTGWHAAEHVLERMQRVLRRAL